MTSATQPTARPPLWRDVRVLRGVFQLVVLAIVVGVIYTLVQNVRINSKNQGIPVGFEFLDQPSSFTIPGNDLRETQPVSTAIFQGFLNTLRVAIVGIIMATLLGIAVGVGRLSGNWLVRNLSRIYVEIFRNIPLLGLVVFAYLGIVLAGLPRVADTWIVDKLLVVNVRGIAIPWITGPGRWLLVVLLVGALVAWGLARWRQSVTDRTGTPARTGLYAGPAFIAIALLGALLIGIGLTSPSLDGRRFKGGIVLQPEYFALLLALVVYTASHIAEIVRGSIQAINKGQVEASMALALSPWQRLRHVVLPQAMRIAIPPLGNQYLNLMKNSSLGFVISYFELTKVTSTTIGNRSPVIPAYLVLMVIYLGISLIISAGMNLLNRRLQIEGR